MINIIEIESVKNSINDVLETVDLPDKKLQKICNLLRESMEDYHWVGYYLVDIESASELILGPFAGDATEYTRIDFGRGVCGQVADTLAVRVVDDVSLESNYLSCSPAVRSEFVAPLLWNGKLVGELDLDSGTKAAFRKSDVELLKWVAEVTAEEAARVAGLRLAE
ncbi:MAG: GAF domain-containing protein [Candidatus Fermentibacteria bacterium]|nr:GAF domain-containing protein [Candidatus Fermentibacteria bacterium]